jgi:hypothetical protein
MANDTPASHQLLDSVPAELKDFYSKYDESFQFLQTRKRRQVAQIVLLNNLQRGDENIASTLLITLFNRILSNLYDDKMQVKFVPGEEIDQKKVNSLNILAQNDYREMDKAKLDYDWDWDTLFFGRGYVETLRFDKTRKIMRPEVINPLAFGYDPFFENSKEWRYYWKWITKSYWDIQKLINKGIITGIKNPNEIASGIDPYLWDYKIRREQAKLVTPQANDTYQGDVFQILEFYGYNKDGDKCVFWIDRDFTKVLYQEVLDLKDAPDGKDSEWPIVVKEAFREPHSSVVFSVADLLEDKHRARSVLLNLAFIAAKDKANPLYQYNPDQIKDLSQLFNRQIAQHIPVTDVTNSIAPLNTANPMDNGLNAFMQMLSQEANDPVGTGMSLAPAKKGKASATENAIQQQLNDLAQSLQSKVMQFGEEEFWKDWYHRYRRNTKAGDEKIATVTGVKGMTFEKIDLGDIHTKYPPGVLIFSAKDAEYKELVLRRDLMQMYPQFESTLDPDGMRVFNKYVFFPKFLQDPSMIDALFPETVDELKAAAENDSLAEDKFMVASDTDDHTQHILVHMMAKKTWATWLHIGMHQELLALQKKQQMAQGKPSPDQQQEKPQDQKPPGKGDTKGGKGKQPQQPMQATAPSMGAQGATPLPTQAKTM